MIVQKLIDQLKTIPAEPAQSGLPVACARCKRLGRDTEAVSLGDNWVECPICGPFLDLTHIILPWAEVAR